MADDILGHIPALRAYARALCRNPVDADDLIQETLLRAVEYSSSYRRGTNMRGWLFTIMRNRFLTNLGKRSRETTGAADCVAETVGTPPNQDWHMLGCELARALVEMPIHYREVVVLVLVIGESYIDASRILDCDIGTIKSRLNRGRTMLKAKLGALT